MTGTISVRGLGWKALLLNFAGAAAVSWAAVPGAMESDAVVRAGEASSKAEKASEQAEEATSRAATASSKAETASSKAESASEQAGEATQEAARASHEASSASSQASEASEKAGAATERADKAIDQATEAAKKAEAAADKASAAAEKLDEATEKVEEVASRTSVSTPSNRMSHQVGVYASLWGDPFPTTLGINAAYNVYDWARVNLGVGSDNYENFKTATAGVGVKLMVPTWPLTPVVGANLSFTKADNSTNPRTVRGFDPRGAHGYANAGVDWETGIGLNFAVGYIFPFQGNLIASGSWYLNTGLFL